MAKYKNYKNEVSNDNKIYTREDIGAMSGDEYAKLEKAINHQWGKVGIPTSGELAGDEDVVYVHSYKRDGETVKAHYRSKPGHGNHQSGVMESAGINHTTPQSFLTGGVSYDELFPLATQLYNNADASGIKQIEPMNLWEQIQNYTYQNLFHKMLPEASNNVRNGMNDLEEARNNPNATIINSFKEVRNPVVRDILKKSKVKDNERGVYYNENSQKSQKIANSPFIEQFIKDNYKAIESGELLTSPQGFGLKPYSKQTPFAQADNYGSLQHFTIYKPQIKDGYFTAYIIDHTDYEHRDDYSLFQVPNNWANDQQDKGRLENYFTLNYIKKNINRRK